MLLRSPGPISPDTYSGHIRRRALCPNRLRNGMSQRSSPSCQSDILATMVRPSQSRPTLSHRKTDLGIPCRSKSAKVVLVSRARSGGWLAVIGRAASPSEKTARASIVPQVRDEVKWRGKNKSLNPADKGLPCRCASLALLYKATGGHKNAGRKKWIFLRPILVLRSDAARMALGDASCYAAPLAHHSGSTGGEYPASSWPQPMVDNPRVCAAGKSDRLMGVCVHPMAQPHLGRWPAGVSSAVCSRAGGPRARNPAPAHGLAGPDEVKRHGEK